MKRLAYPMCLALVLLVSTDARAVAIDSVPVDNPANAADATLMNDGTSEYGSVPKDAGGRPQATLVLLRNLGDRGHRFFEFIGIKSIDSPPFRNYADPRSC